MNVGKSLKVALAKKGIRQNELAKRIGVTRQWIGRLANSERAGMGSIEKLAKAFDLKPMEFLALGED
jgi:transcriptional regulator with XRE-family HTH domain